jgi:hypothetical protein
VLAHAPAQAVWDGLTDWPAQGEWMTATRVRTVDGDGQGVGGRIEAFTGFGRLGFLDTMVVTEWRPPNWCAVQHTGRVVRGRGAFAVEAVDDAGAADDAQGAGDATGSPHSPVRLRWYEDLDLPGGVLGAFGWRLLRPFVRIGVAQSLRRLARSVERASGA